MPCIVIATPHARYDSLEGRVRGQLGEYEVIRIRGRGDLSATSLTAARPKYVFFPHWSWRIPDEIADAHECVVFHMTDLPFGRGGSPLQNLIASGTYSTKLTALKCVREIDSGPVYAKRAISLLGTAEEIYARAADLMVEMIVQIVRERPEPVPQAGVPTVFNRRLPADGDISALEDLQRVFDFIRMLDADGYPPAFLETARLRFEFSRASLRTNSLIADVRITLKDRKEHEK